LKITSSADATPLNTRKRKMGLQHRVDQQS
jgi:hypothetical protein